jgi:hypothetical protein
MGERRTHIHRRKQQLIARDSCDNGAVLGFQIDVLGEQAVPFGCCGTEDDYCVLALLRSLYVSRYMLRTTAVSSHARCSHRVVRFEAALLDELLRENITGGEENLYNYCQRLLCQFPTFVPSPCSGLVDVIGMSASGCN